MSSRDLDETPFSAALNRYLNRADGADAAILVDGEGEAVDYAGDEDPFELRVLGATFAIVVSDALSVPKHRIQRIQLNAVQTAYSIDLLEAGYFVITRYTASAAEASHVCARSALAAELAREAGWHEHPEPWLPAQIVVDAAGRPEAIHADSTYSLAVIGREANSDATCIRYRVHLQTGQELTLAREGSAAWYSDKPVQSSHNAEN
jgi:hypothetical protein